MFLPDACSRCHGIIRTGKHEEPKTDILMKVGGESGMTCHDTGDSECEETASAVPSAGSAPVFQLNYGQNGRYQQPGKGEIFAGC